MARKKLPEDVKKKEISITINEVVNDKLDIYLNKLGINNKSKYIEKLIKDDLKNKKD